MGTVFGVQIFNGNDDYNLFLECISLLAIVPPPPLARFEKISPSSHLSPQKYHGVCSVWELLLLTKISRYISRRLDNIQISQAAETDIFHTIVKVRDASAGKTQYCCRMIVSIARFAFLRCCLSLEELKRVYYTKFLLFTMNCNGHLIIPVDCITSCWNQLQIILSNLR